MADCTKSTTLPCILGQLVAYLEIRPVVLLSELGRPWPRTLCDKAPMTRRLRVSKWCAGGWPRCPSSALSHATSLPCHSTHSKRCLPHDTHVGRLASRDHNERVGAGARTSLTLVKHVQHARRRGRNTAWPPPKREGQP